VSSTYYKTAEDFDWYKYHPATNSVTTGHLSHIELGVYRRMLDHYWTSDNKLPKDTAEIAERIGEKVFNWRRYGITAPAGFNNEEITIKVVEHLLNEFFDDDEDGNWRNPWLDDYRKATDAQFKERSKVSKERAARQPRGSGGKFGKLNTVADGEVAVINGDADGEVAVEHSTDKVEKLDQIQNTSNAEQQEQSKPSDVASPLVKIPSPKEEPAFLMGLPEEQKLVVKGNMTRMQEIKSRDMPQAA
jgi:uncharacterized protein YdaU (DUF1376 family)